MNAQHTPTPILADAVCTNCQHRIGWHDQRFGCPGFSAPNLREMYGNWIAENEPPSGFRNDKDVPSYVLLARAALERAK